MKIRGPTCISRYLKSWADAELCSELEHHIYMTDSSRERIAIFTTAIPVDHTHYMVVLFGMGSPAGFYNGKTNGVYEGTEECVE